MFPAMSEYVPAVDVELHDRAVFQQGDARFVLVDVNDELFVHA